MAFPGNPERLLFGIFFRSTAEMGRSYSGFYRFNERYLLFRPRLVKRFGTRKVIRTTMTCAVGGMVILSVALWCAFAADFCP